MFDKLEQLLQGYVCIVDCAYQSTEHIVPIFGGDLALRKKNENFNVFASQLCIQIEMAFGIMTRKWGILQHPLSNSLLSIKHIICCIAQLHSFCISEQLLENSNAANFKTTDALSFTQLAYMHSASPQEHHKILSFEYPQWSLARQELVKAFKEK